jgi:23S rRNA (cytidine1920-2'-O)/16S rRNA (cytidine1409-2'-O)-methyltransferase
MTAGAAKRRIDQLLVERGLAPTREKARALILAGCVTVNGQRVDKAGHMAPADCRLEVGAGLPYVSRAGVKLAAALDHFGIEVEGKVCLDVGASTGGFTDCLLQRGARRVYAIDVGVGQLDWKLRNDPRVVVREGVNARYLGPEHVPEPVDLATCDVSFISVTLILPAVAPLIREGGGLVALVKPQFEVGRGEVGKGGIVRDPELHRAACAKVVAAAERLGFCGAIMESPITGAEGNKEFLYYATR